MNDLPDGPVKKFYLLKHYGAALRAAGWTGDALKRLSCKELCAAIAKAREGMTMRTAKEIRADIRETKREMKHLGIKRSSCFNGGHSPDSYRFNARLYALSSELEKAQAKGE